MKSTGIVFLVALLFVFTGLADAQSLELIGSIDTPGDAHGVSVFGDYAYVADWDSGLQIINISDPSNPSIVGNLFIANRACDVFIYGDYAYVAEDDIGSLWIVDITDPANPSVEGIYYGQDRVYSLFVEGDYAYIIDGYAGFKIINVANPSIPSLVGWYDTPGAASGVYVSGNYAYVTDYDYTLHVFNISNPNNPTLEGSCIVPGLARKGVFVQNGYAYVGNWDTGLQIIDVNNPSNPFQVSSYDTPGYALDVVIINNFACVADWEQGLQVIDVSNPMEPIFESSYYTSGIARGIEEDGEYIYVVNLNSLMILSVNGVVGEFTLDIAETLGEQGQSVEVPIFANGLGEQEVAGVELHIGYNVGCLGFLEISSDYLIDALVNVEDGQIHILWEDYQNPFVIPEEGAILSLHFTILGELGQTCSIEWLDNSELVDPLGEIIQGIEYLPGSITVVVFSSISGNVHYYDFIKEIADVTLELTGENERTTVTEENGLYIFEELAPGDYTLTPSRAENDLGVTVSDLVNIRRHIVYLELLDSPYKSIAADVSVNGNVSVADVIMLRRYLAELDDLPSGNWAFVDSSFEITDDNWPEAPHHIDAALIYEDISGLNFIGIRMGDVDNSWGEGGLLLECLTDSVVIQINNTIGMPDESVSVPVTVTGFTNVAGIELHLEFPANDLSFTAINSDILDGPTTNGENGEIHLVWEDISNTLTLDDGAELLSIEFDIAENAPDSIPVSFTITYVVDEFGADFYVESIDGFIVQGQTGIGEDFESLPDSYILSQNYPNPFNSSTIIQYSLPDEAYVNINIYDLLGRNIETLVGKRQSAGLYQITWNADHVPSGIYFYKIQADDFIDIKKMILMK